MRYDVAMLTEIGKLSCEDSLDILRIRSTNISGSYPETGISNHIQ